MAQDLNVSVENKENKGASIFAAATIAICLVIGFLVWKFVMGASGNFEGGDAENGHPLPGNYLGMVYKGGAIVPALMGLLLMTLVFSIERFIVISKAAGKGDLEKFVKNVLGQIKSGDVQGAIVACDEQQGSVANVVKSRFIKIGAS